MLEIFCAICLQRMNIATDYVHVLHLYLAFKGDILIIWECNVKTPAVHFDLLNNTRVHPHDAIFCDFGLLVLAS